MGNVSDMTDRTGTDTLHPAEPHRVGWIGPVAVSLALLSALLTFLVLSGFTPIAPRHEVVVTVLLINAATVTILVGVVASEIWQLVQAWRRGRVAARLHGRIVGLFSIIAVAPAVLVAIVASVTLERGLDRWFSERAQSVIDSATTVANAYIRDQAQGVKSEVKAMAQDLIRAHQLFDQDRQRFRQFLTAQASIRGLPVTMLITSKLEVVDRADIQIGREFVIPPNTQMGDINDDEPVVAVAPDTRYVAALIRLREYGDLNLFAARPIDPGIADQLRITQSSILDYRALEQRRIGVMVAFALMYAVVAMIVLLAAVWIGLNFANRLVTPIRRLISAANLVSEGNLYVQVPIRKTEGDLAQLGESFNKMTQELRTQRDDLTNARDLMDSRRRFIEAVLAGVSAGVIGLDDEGRIGVVNKSAAQLLQRSPEDACGDRLDTLLPELASVVAEGETAARPTAAQIAISRDGNERNLSVRVTYEQSGTPHHGCVVTIDDITELVSAQRTSAWADIARRIAHEIKNPLTPIQLSAERLKRKYAASIVEEREIFEQCIETIIRQVGDIGRMVDEFSSFARMPKPVKALENIEETIKPVIFLMRMAHQDIDFDAQFPDTPLMAQIDRRLISQAVTNIIKNATEAIAALPEEQRQPARITLHAAQDEEDVVIDVIDTGIGFPKENRNRLLEPYITTRDKGTGLGLAIVGRIIEDHGGRLELRDAPDVDDGGHGAWVRIRLAMTADTVKQESKV